MAPRDLNKCSKALKRVLANGRRPVGIYLTNQQLKEIIDKNSIHSDGIWFLIGSSEFEGKTRKTVELIPFEFDKALKPKIAITNDMEGSLQSIHEKILNNETDPNFAKEETEQVVPHFVTVPGQRTPPPRTI
jgi:hypothetical protein